MSDSTTSTVSPWKQTIIASMTSYIDAGSIVAGAAGLALWERYLGLESWQTGLLTMCSSNAIGAAIGALIGGVLCDKFGRKFVYTYDLLVYMFGMLFIVFGVSTPQTVFDFGAFSMTLGYILFLFGYLTIGLAVGADVVASWTLIAEQAPAENRARHCGSAQVFWAVGPAVVLLMQAVLGLWYGTDYAPYDEFHGLEQKHENAAKDLETLQTKIPTLDAEKKAMAEKEIASTTQEMEAAAKEIEALRAKLDFSKEPAALSKALISNRIVFGHLILVAFIVWVLRLGMPESDNWKKAKEQEAALIASGKVKQLGMINLLSPTNLKTVLFLCGVYVVWNLAAGTMGMLLPYIYKNVGGISNSLACALTVVLFVASAISTLTIFMALGDRISRRLIYCVIAILFVVAWGLFLLPGEVYAKYQFTAPVLGTVPLVFVLISVLMGINNGSGQQAFYQLWCNELFPSHYRASAQGFTFFMARITVGLWTAAVPVIMRNQGFETAAAIMVGFALFSMLVGTIFAPNTSGKTLEQIEEERYGK